MKYKLLWMSVFVVFSCWLSAVDVIDSAVVSSQPLLRGQVAGLEYAEKKLANGMRIVAIRQPAVKGRALVELVFSGVGAAVERSNQKGLAHLIEHMLFKGTDKSLSEGVFDKIVAQCGGYRNAFTAFDATAYYVSLDSVNWRPILRLFADCMQNAAMDEQHLASEVRVVIKELRRNDDSDMWTWFQKMFKTSLPSNHPHYSCIIGDRADLAALKAENLKAFFKAYYHPDVATLFVVGDIELESTLAAAVAEFEHIPSGNLVLPDRSSEVFALKKGFHEVVPHEVATSTMVLGWHLPACSKRFDCVAEMLVSVLASNDNAVLRKKLVHDERRATNVSAGSWMYKNGGYFFVDVNPFEGQLDECAQMVYAELSKIAKEGVAADLLAKIVMQKRVDHYKNLENMVSGYAGINPDWIERYARYGTLQDCFAFIDDLAQVTSADIQACVAQFLLEKDVMRVDVVPMTAAARVEKTQQLIEQQALEEQILHVHQRTTPVLDAPIPKEYQEVLPLHPEFTDNRVTTVLGNGLSVVTSSNVSSSLCAFELKHKQGEFLADTIDMYMIQVLTEMLVHGSKDMSREAIVEWFYSRAVTFSATSLFSLKEEFLPALEKLFSIIFSAEFNAGDLEKIKTQTREVIRNAQKDVQFVAARLTQQQLYQQTPRDFSWQELEQRLDELTVERLRGAFVEYFDPSKMVAFVVADIPHENIVKTIKGATTSWSSGAGKNYTFTIDQTLQPAARVNEHVLKDQVWIQFVRSSGITATDLGLFKLQVLTEVLTRRVYKLREESGLFYLAQMALARGLSANIFGFDFAVAQTGTELLDKAFALFDRFFSSDILEPISPQELAGAQLSAKSGYLKTFSGISGELSWCKNLTLNNIGADFYANGMREIDEMTPESATELLRKNIQALPFTRICVGNLQR